MLGCAQIAYRSTIPALLQCDGVELAAVASRTQDKAERFAALGHCRCIVGYQELLHDKSIDAVYIPLPAGLHQEWVIRALQHGKHVLVEKPLGQDYEAAMRMAEAAQMAGRLLMENYAFGLHSQLQFLQYAMRSPKFGEFRLLRSSFGFPPLPDGNFRYDPELGGGVLRDAAGYPLKLCRLLLGNELSVCAAQVTLDPRRKVDMYGSATVRDKDGRIAQLAFGFDNFYQCSCEIWGSKGKISTSRIFTAPPQLPPVVIIESEGVREEHQLPPDNQFLRLIENFRNVLISGDFSATLDDAVHQARLLQDVRNLTGA